MGLILCCCDRQQNKANLYGLPSRAAETWKAVPADDSRTMKIMAGTKEIDCTEQYDQEDDVYYITFKTGEPSHVVEIDDVLFVEVGIFTGRATGLRILNYSKHKIEDIKLWQTKIVKALEPARTRSQAEARDSISRVGRALQKVLAA